MASFEAQLAKAHYAQIIGDFDSAVQQYTLLAASNSNSYELLIAKATALQSTHDFAAAAKDAESAIALDGARWEGYFRRGSANFLLGQHKQALSDFESALQKTQDKTIQRRIEVQVSKAKSELEGTKIGGAVTSAEKPAPSASSQAPAATSAATPQKITYTWYQTMHKVGIEFPFQLSDKNQLKVNFQARRLELSFPIETGRDYDMQIDLFGEIDPAKSKSIVSLQKIEILLEKKVTDENWLRLDAPADRVKKEGGEATATAAAAAASAAKPVVVEEQRPFYPSSSKVKKDWSKIDSEIEEDMKKNKEEYGADPLNSLFQQIYSNADENTRRAMVKSFQTSGGTVLSTNWDEVGTKDYEGKDRPDAPKGQEWKKN